MNCVNSISQMNSCEHSSLIPPDLKGDKTQGPIEGECQWILFEFDIILS